jgi:hypothetical protein
MKISTAPSRKKPANKAIAESKHYFCWQDSPAHARVAGFLNE